jgi:hypothetical protein
MTEIEKLQQLVNVFKAAINEGIASDNWLRLLREKMHDYGRGFMIRESELIRERKFLEWFASQKNDPVSIFGGAFVAEGEILLALHDRRKSIDDIEETLLEHAAYEVAVQKANGVEVFAVEDAYNKLYDLVIQTNNGRRELASALKDLVLAIEKWLDGCEMIDVKIW